MRTFAIILAGGSSERMGFDKVQAVVRGKPLWRYSFETFSQHPEIGGVGIVSTTIQCPEAAFVVPGGSSRTESSRRGIAAVPEEFDAVLIHDAARPLVSGEVISRVIEGVRTSGAATCAIAAVDTIKEVSSSGVRTLDRRQLRAAQTPQGAFMKHFRDAVRQDVIEATDDMVLLESVGIRTMIVEGDPRNFKVTTPDDLLRFAAVLGPPETRTGFGYDIHRFSTDSSCKLVLGGVAFEGVGLEGHSDADVVIHAAVDALLGAATLGDIGELFPNTDLRWKDKESGHFLKEAGRLLDESGWTVLNLDIAVIAERPKIMPRSAEIRSKIASILGIDQSRVSIKATTSESLGALGRGEGIAAHAVATIRERH